VVQGSMATPRTGTRAPLTWPETSSADTTATRLWARTLSARQAARTDLLLPMSWVLAREDLWLSSKLAPLVRPSGEEGRVGLVNRESAHVPRVFGPYSLYSACGRAILERAAPAAAGRSDCLVFACFLHRVFHDHLSRVMSGKKRSHQALVQLDRVQFAEGMFQS